MFFKYNSKLLIKTISMAHRAKLTPCGQGRCTWSGWRCTREPGASWRLPRPCRRRCGTGRSGRLSRGSHRTNHIHGHRRCGSFRGTTASSPPTRSGPPRRASPRPSGRCTRSPRPSPRSARSCDAPGRRCAPACPCRRRRSRRPRPSCRPQGPARRPRESA